MSPTEALAAISALLDRPGAWDGDLYGNDVQRVLDQVETGDQGGASFTARPVPIPADQPLLALWVHVDLDGRASFGGRMTAADTVTTLRFLADQVEAGDVKLGRQQ